MTNIIIHGCNGRMGHMLSEMAADYTDLKIVAGVDMRTEQCYDYPVYPELEQCPEADVIIDFSNAAAVDGLIAYATRKKTAAVICSTGLSDSQVASVQELAKTVPVLRSGNMSMGINTIIKVLKEISPTLAASGFDVDIVEKHHNKKLDAPSGTAIMLADAVNESIGENYEYVYDRSGRRQQRPIKEIGISAVRGGTIVGEHEIIFAGNDEIIEIKHTALSRGLFANGALNAALFLKGKQPGLYSMADVV